MLTIRLARIGKKKEPMYRLIINEKKRDTRGDYLENLGFYNPRTKQIQFETERITYWLSKGATTSPTVHNLLINQKIIAGAKRSTTTLKRSKSEVAKKLEAAHAAPAA
ncbi:MAG: 30S ribosomal protein S16 [Patescibacteria group bacterium]